VKTSFASRWIGQRGLALGSSLVALVALVVACRATEDPRPGLARTSRTDTLPDPLPPPLDAGVVPDAALLPSGPLACGAAPASPGPFTKAALLGAAADCAAWHSCRFENAAIVLKSVVESDARGRTAESLALAQLAYRNAMTEWSSLELFQFGPVADRATDRYHGRGLRAFVHSWPDTSRCQVETQVVTKGYLQGFDLVFPSGRGLFALDYLLHYPGRDTDCSASSSAGTAWASLSPEALSSAKSAYAAAVAGDLAAQAGILRRVWLPEGEGFRAKLLAFDGYGSEQETLNVVAWSLLYPEQEIKDLKLGSLAGFQTSPPISESPFARLEIETIRTNLRAFRSLFQGCGPDGQGIGFDDWLMAAGASGLSDALLSELGKAVAAADAFPPFANATEAQFVDFYLKVRPLANLLKTSFFGSASPLNLKLPASAASDTD
jgi:predicted lipoprotein